jgi:hypothetical protein
MVQPKWQSTIAVINWSDAIQKWRRFHDEISLPSSRENILSSFLLYLCLILFVCQSVWSATILVFVKKFRDIHFDRLGRVNHESVSLRMLFLQDLCWIFSYSTILHTIDNVILDHWLHSSRILWAEFKWWFLWLEIKSFLLPVQYLCSHLFACHSHSVTQTYFWWQIHHKHSLPSPMQCLHKASFHICNHLSEIPFSLLSRKLRFPSCWN